MKTREISVIFLLLLTILISGCNWTPASNVQNNSPTPTGETERILTTPEEDTPQPTRIISSNASLQGLIEKSEADLAQQLSIPVSQINLMTTLEVTWPDSSLGCPQAGTVYLQVLTEGFMILLEAGGERYEYHANAVKQVVLCENPALSIIPIKPGEIVDGQPWMPVEPIQPGAITPSK